MSNATATRSDAEAVLGRFVRSVVMPCPYARSPTTYVHLGLDTEGPELAPPLHRALSAFYEDRSTLVLCVIPTSQPADHRAARAQAYNVRCHLHLLHLELTGAAAGRAELTARLRAQYAAWSDDQPSFVGPRVVVGSMDVMTTAFNPHYPPEHPRHAPYACLVVIRTEDLRAVHDRRPDLSRAIAVRAKCQLLRSMLTDPTGLEVATMCDEYPAWVPHLRFYQAFVTTSYTASYRMDPSTLPRLHEMREYCAEAMSSDRFLASLIAFRATASADPAVPVLARILDQNPDLTVFDVARIVFGDVAGMYVPA